MAYVGFSSIKILCGGEKYRKIYFDAEMQKINTWKYFVNFFFGFVKQSLELFNFLWLFWKANGEKIYRGIQVRIIAESVFLLFICRVGVFAIECCTRWSFRAYSWTRWNLYLNSQNDKVMGRRFLSRANVRFLQKLMMALRDDDIGDNWEWIGEIFYY